MLDNREQENSVTLSNNALRRLKKMTSNGEFFGKKFRVSVSGGGCSGFQYGFSFDETVNDDDHIISKEGIVVLIDSVSWDLLIGSEIHFAEELIGSYFTIRNPNAVSTCGCGVSFSIG